MLKLKRTLKLKPAPSTQGFSLTEVLVGIVVLSGFGFVGMQGFALSGAMRSQSQSNTVATDWIQQDLEGVKSQATQLAYTLSANANSGQATVTLSTNYGLAANDQVVVGTDTNIYKVQSVSGNTITLTTNLGTTQTAGAQVVPVSQCNATSSTTGLGNLLQNNLPTLSSSNNTKTISGKSYTLSRTVAVSNSSPYDTLQVTYNVTPSAGGSSVAKMYTEVMPNVVLQCPKS